MVWYNVSVKKFLMGILRLKEFFMAHKKVISIVACVLGTAIISTAAALLLVWGMGKAAPAFTEISTTSDTVSEETVIDETPIPETPAPVPEIGLVINKPAKSDVTVTTDKYTISGTADAAHPLTMNGAPVTLDSNGAFSVDVELKIGANKFVFEHKGKTQTVTIRYRYVVINGYEPSGRASYESGAVIAVSVSARAGSAVTAKFNGQTVNLTRQTFQEGEPQPDGFVGFTGVFTLPSGNLEALNLGKITYTATYNGVTDSYSSGNITCKKAVIPHIAEVTAFTAETFNGATTDDYSDPRNNYLPRGTVDQIVGTTVVGNLKYVNLRCGRRVYVEKKESAAGEVKPVVSVTAGTVPNTNSITFSPAEEGQQYTKLVVGTDWKAPFFLDVLPQSYANPSKRNFTVSGVTCEYVQIEFCYATLFTGEITFTQENPLFTHAEVFQNAGSVTVRLHLKNAGIFRGWDADYNAAGQLVFSFLNPSVAEVDDNPENPYGATLNGITVVVDAGHGGKDPGAIGKNGTYESERNLNLAFKIKRELESVGATVIMTRTDDSYVTADRRLEILKNARADFCVSVHHDSATSSSANGFKAFYFNAWTSNAAKLIETRTRNSAAYSKIRDTGWHYFFLSRASYCPSVLTENGYMGGSFDAAGILNDSVNDVKAKAIVEGIVDYFLSY